jgi:hypothetical protein
MGQPKPPEGDPSAQTEEEIDEAQVDPAQEGGGGGGEKPESQWGG